MASQFATAFLFLILALHASHNSLLSRFRNPNEFVAPVDSLELDPDTYADLLEEVPELRGSWKMKDSLRMPYIKANIDENGEYELMMNGIDPFDNVTDVTTIVRSTTAPLTPNNSLVEIVRHPHQGLQRMFRTTTSRPWYYYNKNLVASCYSCNTFTHYKYTPHSTVCYDAWESNDGRARGMQRVFRTQCTVNRRYRRIVTNSDFDIMIGDSFMRKLYGPYTGGCFKRFLDVGKVYTSRGCRATPPEYNSGFVRARFQSLETLLKDKDDACIVSPHASLTPFSRSVSLYVRYHVCVCKADYCNSVESLVVTPPVLILLLFCLVL